MREARPTVNIDWDAMRSMVDDVAAGRTGEMLVRENIGREGADELAALAKSSGLYFMTYGRGTNTVHCVSRDPLPDYRVDLDPRANTEREVHIPQQVQRRMRDALDLMGGSKKNDAGDDAAHHSKRVRESPKSAWDEDIDADMGEGTPSGAHEPNPVLSNALREAQRQQQAAGKVQRMMEYRKKLPAWKKRDLLLQAVRENQVLVVSGETGCGKTTQLPQFILEQAIEDGRGAETNIICTQPRRISAISVAQRVAEERGEAIGGLVGYQIRLEARRSADTRLLFCTTGVLLRRLVNDPTLSGVSHVIVDEIHERGCNEDFLLIILRDILPKRPDLRIVLMSATLNSHLFAEYFGGCPSMEIPGFTHPVEDVFLEDILERTRITISPGQGLPSTSGRGSFRRGQPREVKSPDSPWQYEPAEESLLARGYGESTVRSLQAWAETFNATKPKDVKNDLVLVERVLEHICSREPPGAVLVFLTGWDEISNLHKALQANRAFSPTQVRVLPLHGSMPTVNQQEIFGRPPDGVRKVVLATNIAETSITIDDVVYVVDCGKAKEKSYDPLNKLATLLPQWIAQASARQRRGRAGRVQPGKCFKLYPKALHDEMMAPYQDPEMIRTPLEELCLQIKSLKLGAIEEFLSKALQPPDRRAVHNAKMLLKAIGALDAFERLTPLGEHLAHLPVDPLVGKMILMGAVFSCLDPVLTIAAGLAHRDPWVIPLERKHDADAKRRMLAGNTQSDHMALVAAFDGWRNAGGGRERSDYCWQNYLRQNTLELMADMRVQFAELLGDAGFLNLGDKDRRSRGAVESEIRAHSANARRTDLVRAVVCAGMFPNIAIIDQRKNRAGFRTLDDGKVNPHPSSVIAADRFFSGRFLAYSQKVKTKDINLMMSTVVSDHALLFFGGSVSRGDRGTLTMLDGKVSFNMGDEAAELILRAREELEGLLERKVRDPKMDLDKESRHLVLLPKYPAFFTQSVVVQLLSQDSSAEERRRYFSEETNAQYAAVHPVNIRR